MSEILVSINAMAMLYTGFSKRFTWDDKWKILVILFLNTLALQLGQIIHLLRDTQ